MSFSPIGFLFHTHSTLSPVGLAPPLKITTDINFLIRCEVFPTHVWTSMGYREMHGGLASSGPLYLLKSFLLFHIYKFLDVALNTDVFMHHHTCLFLFIFVYFFFYKKKSYSLAQLGERKSDLIGLDLAGFSL